MTLSSLNQTLLYQKILGCWIGKNCGGTLGAPLEKPYSEEEPFDVSFYPVIQEGGIPNDDLELQLIWLKALEEKGIDLTADDLVQYWLNHVAYNFDEYGLMKANFRLGLHPPISGFYNNFFKHSMGCPIRTEVWACIAPGNPRLAAHYAFLDSICDHGGGESINGSLFNVTVESAAFILSDPGELIEIGLSYLPAESLTARCVRAAYEAHTAGVDWLEARQLVLAVGASPIAQFSPPNIAFQVIGWLYGSDFGDALCKSVNCGYDTDCTGATLGSILGIIAGEKNLPEKWKAPLGEAIATNEVNGGLKHLSSGGRGVPKTLTELTKRVVRIQQQVESKFGPAVTRLTDLYADDSIRNEVASSPTVVSFSISPRFTLKLDYLATPQIQAGESKEIAIRAEHTFQDTHAISFSILPPKGWECRPHTLEGLLKPGTPWTGKAVLKAPHRGLLSNRNEVLFRISSPNLPTLASASLAVIGAPAYLRSLVYSANSILSAVALLDEPFEPETLKGAPDHLESRGKNWQIFYADGHDVAPGVGNFTKGVIYVRHFIKSVSALKVWMHTCSRVPAKVWLNDELVFRSPLTRHMRPAAWGTQEGGLHGEVSLREGWNEFLFKFAADTTTPPFACHIVYSNQSNFEEIIVDLQSAQFPWDRP